MQKTEFSVWVHRNGGTLLELKKLWRNEYVKYTELEHAAHLELRSRARLPLNYQDSVFLDGQ